jgi:hypothetical protein
MCSGSLTAFVSGLIWLQMLLDTLVPHFRCMSPRICTLKLGMKHGFSAKRLSVSTCMYLGHMTIQPFPSVCPSNVLMDAKLRTCLMANSHFLFRVVCGDRLLKNVKESCRPQWPRGLRHVLTSATRHWDHGFESRSRHGCVSESYLLCCHV